MTHDAVSKFSHQISALAINLRTIPNFTQKSPIQEKKKVHILHIIMMYDKILELVCHLL